MRKPRRVALENVLPQSGTLVESEMRSWSVRSPAHKALRLADRRGAGARKRVLANDVANPEPRLAKGRVLRSVRAFELVGVMAPIRVCIETFALAQRAKDPLELRAVTLSRPSDDVSDFMGGGDQHVVTVGAVAAQEEHVEPNSNATGAAFAGHHFCLPLA